MSVKRDAPCWADLELQRPPEGAPETCPRCEGSDLELFIWRLVELDVYERTVFCNDCGEMWDHRWTRDA